MPDMTFKEFLIAIALFAFLVVLFNGVVQAINNIRNEKKHRNEPVVELEKRVSRHDELLANDKDRLDRVENEVADHGSAMRILLRQAMAVNDHMISGNDINKLKDSNAEIERYLVNRK